MLFAGLYWGGRTSSGGGGAPAAPDPGARGTALLRTPASGTYVPVTGTVTDSAAIASAYVAFADVTAVVRAGGSGRYEVANVQSGTGNDRYAGWSLVVVYRDATLPLRNLTVFDGLATIQQGEPPLAIGVSGFRTPVSGPVRTSVGLVGYEGDRGSAGRPAGARRPRPRRRRQPRQQRVQQLRGLRGDEHARAAHPRRT